MHRIRWVVISTSESEDTKKALTNLVSSPAKGPLMTVTYFKPKSTGRPPYVRGVFVADDEIDDLLRQSKPRLTTLGSQDE